MSVLVQLIGNAFVWRSGMAVDADGSPHAYHPNPHATLGLDYLANAGYPGNWYGLACNNQGTPYIQGPTDPAPGFCVSTTSLVDRTKKVEDPHRYVDSETVPYITTTKDMLHKGGRLGDIAVVLHQGALAAAIVADVGPHPGEGSLALAKLLGINSDPKHGGVSSGVSFVIFKNSARGWPRDRNEIATTAVGLFASWGGLDKLIKVLGDS